MAMVEFYKSIPGIQFLEWKYDTESNQRSGWFSTSDGILLMIEKRDYTRGPEALVFRHPPLPLNHDFSIHRTSDYTIYILDPDGNTIGFSTYPNPIPPHYISRLLK